MPHPRTLNPSTATLIVVDMQEAFRSAIGDFSLLISRISMAVRGFEVLGVPVIVTEQYPKGLGRTAEELLLSFGGEPEIYEKRTFSSCGADAFVKRLATLNIRQTVICGIEAHVCVNQTAHDLLDRGFDVHLLTDCVASRFEHDKQAALAKMHSSGAIPSTVEMALFEMMSDSTHEKFKEIQALIK
jgi:nicotinamidase-related amidase